MYGCQSGQVVFRRLCLWFPPASPSDMLVYKLHTRDDVLVPPLVLRSLSQSASLPTLIRLTSTGLMTRPDPDPDPYSPQSCSQSNVHRLGNTPRPWGRPAA
jgi:hypothetical protein